MQYDSSESSTQMDRGSKKSVDGVGVVNARPILGFRVKQADGSLSAFDILRIVESVESTVLAIGDDLGIENQHLVYDLCSQVIDVLIKDAPESGIVEVEDLRLQVEITLMLNRQTDLAKTYRESFNL